MARAELGGVTMRIPEDVSKMAKSTIYEREFARLLLERTTLIVEYEPSHFNHADADGVVRGTVPDFRVTNPGTGKVNYIEITASRTGKGRQRNVMNREAPDVNYKVYFGDKLSAIQAKFPEYQLLPDIQTQIIA